MVKYEQCPSICENIRKHNYSVRTKCYPTNIINCRNDFITHSPSKSLGTCHIIGAWVRDVYLLYRLFGIICSTKSTFSLKEKKMVSHRYWEQENYKKQFFPIKTAVYIMCTDGLGVGGEKKFQTTPFTMPVSARPLRTFAQQLYRKYFRRNFSCQDFFIFLLYQYLKTSVHFPLFLNLFHVETKHFKNVVVNNFMYKIIGYHQRHTR